MKKFSILTISALSLLMLSSSSFANIRTALPTSVVPVFVNVKAEAFNPFTSQQVLSKAELQNVTGKGPIGAGLAIGALPIFP